MKKSHYVGEYHNTISNPSFESGFSSWGRDYYTGCSISSDDSVDGKKSLYCKVTNSAKQGTPYQFVSKSNIKPGFYYELSYSIRMNKCSGKVLVAFEPSDYQGCVYAYSTSNESCRNHDCWNRWNRVTARSNTHVTNTGFYILSIGVRDGGLCEFYLDDLQLRPIYDVDVLRSVEIEAWRHELYNEKVKIFVDLMVKNTHWENGEDLNIYVEIIGEERKKIYMRLTDWTLEKREENIVAVFELDASKLASGYYNAKATVTNLYLDNKVETASTAFRVLSKKMEYGIYVDKHRRVIDHGEPFFPLGLMCGSCRKEYFSKYFVDSPFNLVVTGANNKEISELYKEGNKQLRIITNIQEFTNYKFENETQKKSKIDQLAKFIYSVRNNPGLFAYYGANENGIWDVPKLKANAKRIRQIDADHPIWGVINNRGGMHLYKEGLDCYGIDIYPGMHYDDLRAIYTVTLEARDRVVNNLANWGVPQFFDWTIYGQKNEKPPGKDLMNQMMYQMIVGGANGIIWFDFHEMTQSPVDWKPYWKDLKDLTYNLKEKFVPIILSTNEPDPGYDTTKTWFDDVNRGRPCGLRFFRFNNADYILAVNPWRNQDKTCTFGVPDGAKEFEILEGNSTLIDKGNSVTLRMPKMDVTWLKAKNDKYPYSEEKYPKGYFDK